MISHGLRSGQNATPRQARGRLIWKQRLLRCAIVCASFILVCSLWAVLTPRPPLLDGIPFSTAIYDRNGILLRLSLSQDERYRVYTPLEAITPYLREATLLYEDKYFFHHWGINPAALLRAAVSTYASGTRRMGASTISMQLARLRLGLETTTIPGKIRQIERALAYERYYSKEQILEAYLNLAPYGGNVEGCGAAAAIYYHKNAAKLNLMESLALAVVPQNPTRRNPMVAGSLWVEPSSELIEAHGGRALQPHGKNENATDANSEDSLPPDAPLQDARERIFKLWLEHHPQDASALFLAQKRLKTYTPASLPFLAPHATTESLQAYSDAIQIQLTLDMRRQSIVENLISAMVLRNATYGIHNASALLVHWPTMEIRALVGSANFFDASIAGQVDGTRGLRSPGSTLKPFIFALGMDQGIIHPQTLMYDTPRSFRGYEPENADQRFQGPLSATEALRLSRNIPAITLANRLHSPDLFEFLQQSGITFPYTREHYGLALVLGGAEISMRDLARLYALLPNRGERKDLILTRSVRHALPPFAAADTQQIQARGTQETTKDKQALRLLSPEASLLTLAMIHSPAPQRHFSGVGGVKRMTGYWKTGTSNGLRDAWTAGVFGSYVLVVWVGNFDNSPNPAFIGATMAAPLYWDIVEALWELEPMPDPLADLTAIRQGQEREYLNLRLVEVCSGTGDINNDICPEKTESWFIPGVSPIADSGVYRKILIDKASGMRACVADPDKTETVVWEFWPTDLLRVFRTAGIMKKAPPPFLPECDASSNQNGIPPEIISPSLGLTYYRSATGKQGSVLTLHASGDADVTEFFWFCNNQFIGRSTPQDSLVWTPPGGKLTIKVMDNFGRSANREIPVKLTE